MQPRSAPYEAIHAAKDYLDRFGPLTARKAAEALMKSNTNMHQMLDKLVELGKAERYCEPNLSGFGRHTMVVYRSINTAGELAGDWKTTFVSVVPKCSTEEQFLAWRKEAMVAKPSVREGFCEDCTECYQARMIECGRCENPEVRFEVDKTGAISGVLA